MYDTLFSPVQIGSLTLKNRLTFAPTSMGLNLTERLEKYQAVAASGVSLITIGDVSVMPAIHHQEINLFNEKDIVNYHKITDVIHQSGAKVSAQLFAPDYDAAVIKVLMREKQVSHSEIKQLMNDSATDYVTNMPLEQIETICRQFVTAVQHAEAAGFDLIQLHGDRLIGGFMSEIFNHRTDSYGGSASNRCRLATEILHRLKSAITLPIDYKLTVRQENPHYGNAGALLEELPIVAPLLEQAGADSFHVTIANHSELTDTIPKRSHPYFKEEGCFLYLADQVKKYTQLPICGVGKLSDPEYIEEQLSQGRIDLLAMSRQLIADDHWLSKIKAGQESAIKHCLYCNKKCVDALQTHAPFGCSLD